MKRAIFTIVLFILTAAVCFLYCYDPIRNFAVSNYAALADIYAKLDDFFITVFDSSLGKVVSLPQDPYLAENFRCIAVLGLGFIVLALVLNALFTSVYLLRRYFRTKKSEQIKREKEKLNDEVDTKKEFSAYDPNNVNFANNKIPYVHLGPELIYSSSEEDKIVLSDIKYRPIVRIVISVVFFLALTIFIFFRLMYLTASLELYEAFSFLFTQSWFIELNVNLSEFFSHLYSPFYFTSLFEGSAWTIGYIVEGVSYFVAASFVWFLVLVCMHLIMKMIRARRKKVHYKKLVNSQSLSLKAGELIGDASLKEVSEADISSIANIVSSSKGNEEYLNNRAEYIDDISEGVYPAGMAISSFEVMYPSKARKPLIIEDFAEDLSGNKNVTISDIPSIDETKDYEYEKIDVSYLRPEQEEMPSLNLDYVNLSSIARLSKASNKKPNITLDDMIDFDEDGYCYLVKNGKMFVDEKEDISDVINADFVDKTAIVARYGYDTYEMLNELEPFSLDELDIDTEINNIAKRFHFEEMEKEDKLLKQSLSARPFEVIGGVDA